MPVFEEILPFVLEVLKHKRRNWREGQVLAGFPREGLATLEMRKKTKLRALFSKSYETFG